MEYMINKTGSRVGSYSRSILAGPGVAAEPQVFPKPHSCTGLWESESDCATSQVHRLVFLASLTSPLKGVNLTGGAVPE